jgi:parallel beta-helix repeat protein
MIMTTSKIFLMTVIFGVLFQTNQAGIIIVNPGNDLSLILDSITEGDTVLIKRGQYKNIRLTDRKYSEKNPLVVRAFDSDTVFISGDTISRGSSLEIRNCSYIVIEGLTFINSMWGIYVRNSDHIIIRNNEIFKTGQEGTHIGRSSKFVDVIGNKIHNTGNFNSKWGEGIYVGSGSYRGSNFPDNCEYIWIENNHIYETGNGESINIKGECFHVTVRNNKVHDIHPGTSDQHNEAGITVEGTENSIDNNYRLSEKRDVWVENNTVWNVSGGYSNWNNGIMFFGTGVYILNNTIYDCTNIGIYGNNWKNIGLENYVYGNKISGCGTIMYLHPELKIREIDPGKNPHSPQNW